MCIYSTLSDMQEADMDSIETHELETTQRSKRAIEQSGLDAAVAAWKDIMGPDHVLGSLAATAAYGANTSGAERRIAGALRIVDRHVLPDVMRIAHRYNVPVYPISTGRNWGYGTALPAKDDGVIVDLSSLRRILHFDSDLGVVTVEPGVTQGMLAEFLESNRHEYMVPVTGAGPECSLVGNVLERGYGITPHADHFGAMTDVEAVLADGTIYQTTLREAGGEDLARLFKWGLGPYSAGLFSQSGFGIVTQMSLMLAPRPECVKVCLFSLEDDPLLEPAVHAVRALLTRLPGIVGGLNMMNRHRVFAMSVPYPRDQLDEKGLIPASVMEHLGRTYDVAPWTGYVTLYGTKAVVSAAEKEIRAQLRGLASRIRFVSPTRARIYAAASAWVPGQSRLARTAQLLSNSMDLVLGRPSETALPLAYWRTGKRATGAALNPSKDGACLMWYSPLVPMRPAAVGDYVRMVRRVTREHGIEPLITLTSISDKLFDSTVPLLYERGKEASVRECYDRLVASGREIGCFPYRLGIDSMKSLRERAPESIAIHERLRRAFDSNDILAPGRYR